MPAGLRFAVVYLVALGALLLLAQLSLFATRLPVHIELTGASVTATVDGTSLTLPLTARPTAIQFVVPAPTVREFQIDGSDSANNFTEDPAYFARLAPDPYYAFQAWMRASDSYSSWRGVTAEGFTQDRATGHAALPDGKEVLVLPAGSHVVIDAALERLEVPATVRVLCGGALCAELQIDRNDRFISVAPPDGSAIQPQRAYFPQQPAPFLAEVLYLILQVGIWSLLLFGAATLIAANLALFARTAGSALRDVASHGAGMLAYQVHGSTSRVREVAGARTSWLARLPGDRWDALALAIALSSLAWTLYVSLVLFAGYPHLLDSSSYYFQAKIFASGQLSAPAPPLPDAFKGPFMVDAAGRWFSTYPPAASALLAIGMLLRAPWAVEPLLGTLALWGIYRIGRRLYSPQTGVLALLLGALSPFYTFLAAAYMSHAVALCFAVYFLLALLRFAATHTVRDLAFAALAAGGLLLTRELTCALLIIVAGGFLAVTGWRRLWADRERVALALVAALPVFFLAVALYLAYNWLQTGDPYLLPRQVFEPADQYGFGPGIGFYGQHTLAAGLVILDQLLTTLQIDLYGWPFYLTLAFVPLAFLRRSAGRRWDLLCLLGFAVLTLAQVGYFYHGIYLGPRYLYETLPFLLLLTARGILALPSLVGRLSEMALPVLGRAGLYNAGRVATGMLVFALMACNLLYYLPRQVALTTGFTGLPYWKPVDAAAVYAFHRKDAIVLTSDWFIYSYVLFPLNDPNLHGPTLYAYAGSSDTADALRTAYPGRTIYLLQVGPGGGVTFSPLTP